MQALGLRRQTAGSLGEESRGSSIAAGRPCTPTGIRSCRSCSRPSAALAFRPARPRAAAVKLLGQPCLLTPQASRQALQHRQRRSGRWTFLKKQMRECWNMDSSTSPNTKAAPSHVDAYRHMHARARTRRHLTDLLLLPADARSRRVFCPLLLPPPPDLLLLLLLLLRLFSLADALECRPFLLPPELLLVSAAVCHSQNLSHHPHACACACSVQIRAHVRTHCSRRGMQGARASKPAFEHVHMCALTNACGFMRAPRADAPTCTEVGRITRWHDRQFSTATLSRGKGRSLLCKTSWARILGHRWLRSVAFPFWARLSPAVVCRRKIRQMAKRGRQLMCPPCRPRIQMRVCRRVRREQHAPSGSHAHRDAACEQAAPSKQHLSAKSAFSEHALHVAPRDFSSAADFVVSSPAQGDEIANDPSKGT